MLRHMAKRVIPALAIRFTTCAADRCKSCWKAGKFPSAIHLDEEIFLNPPYSTGYINSYCWMLEDLWAEFIWANTNTLIRLLSKLGFRQNDWLMIQDLVLISSFCMHAGRVVGQVLRSKYQHPDLLFVKVWVTAKLKTNMKSCIDLTFLSGHLVNSCAILFQVWHSCAFHFCLCCQMTSILSSLLSPPNAMPLSVTWAQQCGNVCCYTSGFAKIVSLSLSLWSKLGMCAVILPAAPASSTFAKLVFLSPLLNVHIRVYTSVYEHIIIQAYTSSSKQATPLPNSYLSLLETRSAAVADRQQVTETCVRVEQPRSSSSKSSSSSDSCQTERRRKQLKAVKQQQQLAPSPLQQSWSSGRGFREDERRTKTAATAATT